MSDRLDPYFVREQSSRGGFTKYVVMKRREGKRAARVSVHPHVTRQGAQAAADELNIASRVAPYADDPRPYEVRLAEARETYRNKP